MASVVEDSSVYQSRRAFFSQPQSLDEIKRLVARTMPDKAPVEVSEEVQAQAQAEEEPVLPAPPEGFATYADVLSKPVDWTSELSSSYDSLDKSNIHNELEFWYWCYYCALVLEQFSIIYGHAAQVGTYRKRRLEIENRVNVVLGQNPIAELRPSKTAHISAVIASLNAFAANFFKLATIKANISYINLCRLYWTFSRLTLTMLLNLAKELNFIKNLESFFSRPIHVDQIIKAFQAPISVLNYCSVAFFGVNALINFGFVLNHTLNPKEGAKGTTAWQRFTSELSKRKLNFINDVVWAIVNAETNLIHNFSSLAGPITAIFLFMDLLVILKALSIAREDYLAKKAQYLREIEDYENDVALDPAIKAKHITRLGKQIKELDLVWDGKLAGFHCSAAAAALFFLGFSASMVVGSPVLIALSFFTCVMAAALYFSAGSYQNYMEHKGREQQLKDMLPKDTVTDELRIASKQCDIARREFFFTATTKSVTPIILIATFALCWPVGTSLAALCLVCAYFHSRKQHAAKEELKGLIYDVEHQPPVSAIGPP